MLCSSYRFEHRYGLMWQYQPTEAAALLRRLDDLLARDDARASIAQGRARMLAEKTNVARWFTDFIESRVRRSRSPTG